MVVAISVIELHLPAAQSLKQKRWVVKSLVERIHKRFRVSIAETDFHDLHQRAELSIAAVASAQGELDKILQRIRDLVDDEAEAVLTHWDPQFLESGR